MYRAPAYAPSAGAFWEALPETCEGPVDLVHTHGWNDRTVPLEGRPLRNGTIHQGDVWASLKILRETNGCTSRQPTRSVVEGERWLKHWEDCEAGRIDLMLHPGGHGAPKGWAPYVLDWFEARLRRSPNTATPDDLRAYQLHITDTCEASSEWRSRSNFRACHVRDSWNFLTGVIKKI